MENSAVQITLPASGAFTQVFAAAIRALCERMRWPTESTSQLISVATESFDRMVGESGCNEINASLTIIDGGLQVDIAADCELPATVCDIVQELAADLDRGEIDTAARTVTLTKHPNR